VGLGVGLKWMMSQKMREEADPKIRMRDQHEKAASHASIADEDKSLV
jgi:hypothetical protein